MQVVDQSAPGQTERDAYFELVERVCASQELRRAARLRDFLRYVSHRVLVDSAAVVPEQEIGTNVFGRPADYDTGIDNIVRVNASELRKRIHSYFLEEGKVERYQFDIPRGSYTPQFSPRIIEEVAPAPAASTAVSSEPSQNASARFLENSDEASPLLVRLLTTTVLVLLTVCVVLALQLRSARRSINPWRYEPNLKALWTQLLDSNRPLDIVLADTSVVIAQDVLRERIPLNIYLQHDFLNNPGISISDEMKEELENIMSRGNGSFGDFQAARHILALASHSPNVHLEYARSLRPTALKHDNLVLLGSSYSNPWASLYEDRMSFRLTTDPVTHRAVVLNTAPAAGEKPEYSSLPGNSIGYGIVAFLPDREKGSHVLMVAGTTAEATEAASDFITSEDSLEKLKKQLHQDALKHFEILLKTTKLDNTPLSAEIIAARNID
jgi:hypothetical protein